jgi:hypothetical protein
MQPIQADEKITARSVQISRAGVRRRRRLGHGRGLRFESLVAIDPQGASTPSPSGRTRESVTPPQVRRALRGRRRTRPLLAIWSWYALRCSPCWVPRALLLAVPWKGNCKSDSMGVVELQAILSDSHKCQSGMDHAYVVLTLVGAFIAPWCVHRTSHLKESLRVGGTSCDASCRTSSGAFQAPGGPLTDLKRRVLVAVTILVSLRAGLRGCLPDRQQLCDVLP